MLACENNNIIKWPVPKWGRLNCLQRQRNGRKDGPTNKQKAPGQWCQITRPLIRILNWAPSPPTCRLLSAILYITVQRCPHQRVTRMKCILHSYLFGHFFGYFVFVFCKICLFFSKFQEKTPMHRLKFHCLQFMPLFLLCSITLLQTTTAYSSVFLRVPF